jgi:hypothetical protein
MRSSCPPQLNVSAPARTGHGDPAAPPNRGRQSRNSASSA